MRWFRYSVLAVVLLVCLTIAMLLRSAGTLYETYQTLESYTIMDRHGVIIYEAPNERGDYSIHTENYPEDLVALVVAKEDRFFYFHPGINPLSILRALFFNMTHDEVHGASTITQQLVKILRGNEQTRTLSNKVQEVFLSLGLELRYSKKTILTMYLNTVNLGNQASGFTQASLVYYDKPVQELREADQLALVATLSNPYRYNPWQEESATRTALLAAQLGVDPNLSSPVTTGHEYNSANAFEVQPLLPTSCTSACTVTIDASLTDAIRSLMRERLEITRTVGGTEMAVVVIKIPENELLAVVGSPDPFARDAGAQINMSLESRPIGSTIKPFIYAEVFERGARPYSLITDQEYHYPIGSGFPLYPKNFDGTYAGDVTLEHALGNSLNTPSIKLLEFISLTDFYELLAQRMHFESLNPLDSYAYGIALGGLEMDLLTLTHYFTTFPQNGTLSPLHIVPSETLHTPQGTIDEATTLFSTSSVALLNSILTERQIGAEQFGIASTLAVPGQRAAVKTGTSRDFHDSWTVGYTPDYVVGVWLGNAANTALDSISGSVGAGPLWRQTMELLQGGTYDNKTPFSFDGLTTYPFDSTNYYGMPSDDTAYARTFLLTDTLIMRPHHEDVIAFAPDAAVELRAREDVDWYIDDVFFGRGSELFWTPPAVGTYTISIMQNGTREMRTVLVVEPGTPMD